MLRHEHIKGLDAPLFLLYNCVTILNEFTMTVTTNEYGQQNMFAKEPSMYMTKEDLERYGIEPYAVKAERLNGRTAMMGFVAALISYAFTGKLFFGII
jgi:hypothetical protein